MRLVPTAILDEVNVALDPQRAEAADIRFTPTVVIESDDGREIFRAEGAPTSRRRWSPCRRRSRTSSP